MIKFTDEFIKEASYLYQLAEEISHLSLTYLDELNVEDKLVNQKLNVIFKARFNQAVNSLSNEYNKPVIISAMKNYLIGLGCINENALVCEFLDGIDLS